MEDVCNSWEEIEENSELVDKQFEKLKLERRKNEEPENDYNFASRETSNLDKNEERIQLDETREDSLRSQYVPPEPKMKILTRPKNHKDPTKHKTSSSQVSCSERGQQSKSHQKPLEQREKEYAEARMRILGNVRFEAEEAEAALEEAMSPAEILKFKISQAVQENGDNSNESEQTSTTSSSENASKVKSLKSRHEDE